MEKHRAGWPSFLISLAVLAFFLVAVYPGPAAVLPQGIAEAQTPSTTCIPGRVTPAVTAGPFYKAGSPQRTSLLEPGMVGTKFTITGQFFTRGGRPEVVTWLDFWQANAHGRSRSSGYPRLGRQLT